MRRRSQSKRPNVSNRGFTLVELLVVIAIIGILVALLLPAVQAAREAARRAQCTSHIKQVSLAIQNYHSANKALPPAAMAWGTAPGWPARLLPFIEEESRYEMVNFKGLYYDGTNRTLMNGEHFPLYTCPSDEPQRRTTGLGAGDKWTKHNYVVNLGNTGYLGGGSPYTNSYYYGAVPQYGDVTYKASPFTLSGCVCPQWCGSGKCPINSGLPYKWVSFKKVTDGTSKTMLLSEAIQGRSTSAQDDLRGFIWWGNACGFSTYLPPNAASPDVYEGGSWCGPGSVHAGNPPCIAPQSTSQPMTNGARSWHAGGVMVAFCDGSARMVNDDISIETWRALSTIGGDEMIGNDAY